MSAQVGVKDLKGSTGQWVRDVSKGSEKYNSRVGRRGQRGQMFQKVQMGQIGQRQDKI